LDNDLLAAQPQSSRRIRLGALVPTLPEKERNEIIEIDPLHPAVVRLVMDPKQNESSLAAKARQMFCENHLQSMVTRFVKQRDTKNDFNQLNQLFADGLEDKCQFKLDLPTSNDALLTAIKLYATAVSNLFETNILYRLTTRALKKIFLHEFAPRRTARHLAHRNRNKEEKIMSPRQKVKKLYARRKKLIKLSLKKTLPSALREELEVNLVGFDVEYRKESAGASASSSIRQSSDDQIGQRTRTGRPK
jgi:hypothetical protein